MQPENKVLLLSTSSSSGGGPQVVLDLADGLRERNVVVEVALPPNGIYVERFKKLGMPIHLLSLNSINFRVWWSLYRLVKANQYTVLHSHGKGASFAARIVGLITNTPVIHTHHGIHVSLYGKIQQKIYIALERALSRITWKFVNVSYSQEKYALEYKLFKPEQSEVIYISTKLTEKNITRVEAKRWLRKEFGLPKDAIVFLMVARFDPVKNHKWFLSSYAKFAQEKTNARLLLVGDGELLYDCKELVGELGLKDSICFAGLRSDIEKIMLGADVFVLPSLREGLPLSMIEAMFQKLPLIGSDVVGINEVVIPQQNGELFKLGDAEDMVSTLVKLYDSSSLRERYGENGKSMASQKFSMDLFIEKHITLYSQAVMHKHKKDLYESRNNS